MHTMLREFDQMPGCLCHNLRKASREMTHFFSSSLAGHGLLPTQTPILTALHAHPGATMAELSEWLGMDRTTMVRNLQPLQREGLVSADGKGRGRRASLNLTPKGARKLRDFEPHWQEVQQKAVATLGARRWSEILDDLDRVARSLSSE